MDILTVVLALVLVPIWGTIGWGVIEGAVRPYLIPRAEIEGLADEMMCHPDPERAAYDRERTAAHRGDSFEQGKWRRVRKRVRGRVEQHRRRAE